MIMTRLVLCFATFFSLVVLSFPAQAQQLRKPSVTVTIDGGIPSDEFAALFQKLVDEQGKPVVPLANYTVKQGDTICGILNSQLKIDDKHCGTTLIKAVASFNPDLKSPDALQADQTLQLPKLTVERYFANQKPVQVGNKLDEDRLETIKQNWVTKTDNLVRWPGTTRETKLIDLTVKGYRIEFQLDATAIESAEKNSSNLGRGNMSIFVDSGKLDPKAAYALDVAPQELQRKCAAQEAGVDKLQASYASLTEYPYADKLPNLTCSKTCEGADCKTRVVIIDKPIPMNSELPELEVAGWCKMAEAVDDPPRPAITTNNCGPVEFSETTDHSVHMAGIIGSLDNGVGLKGMNSKPKLCSFHWTENTSANDLVKYVFNQRLPTEPLHRESQVVLFASNFDEVRDPVPRYSDESLRLDKNGFSNGQKLNAHLADDWMSLWVVAAGQDESANVSAKGLALGVYSKMSPQNLGDQDNVLVVTACTGCKEKESNIWARGNFSEQGQRMVHLAAPGGERIFGLSRVGLGVAEGGTSQAAAYVAGVASEMMRCHDYFANSGGAKQRLILTSTPQLSSNAWKKVSGGVVSADLAMLDPKKNWLKPKGERFQSVKKISWCKEFSKLNTNHVVDFVNVRRIYALAGDTEGRQVVFTDEQGQIAKSEPAKFASGIEKPTFKVYYDDDQSEVLSISDIDDLILGELTDAKIGCE